MDEAVMQTRLMEPTLTSVPIPKFAHPRGPLRCELRNQRDTSNFMILVRHLDLKFLNEFAAIIIGTSNPPHYMMSSFVPLTAPGARGKMSTAEIALLDRGKRGSGHGIRSANVIYLTPG